MISSGTLSFWDPLAHKTFSNQCTPAFLPTSAGGCIAQTRWNTDQQNFVAQAHWSAQKKSVTGRNLGPGSRCHKKTLRAGQQALAELSTRIKGHQRPKHLLCVEVSIFVDSLGRAAGMRPAAPESQVQMMQQDATRSHTQIQRPYRFFSNLDVLIVNMQNGCTILHPPKNIWTKTHRAIDFNREFQGIFRPSYHTTWQHWRLDGVGHWIHVGGSTNWCVGILCLTGNFCTVSLFRYVSMLDTIL